MLRKLKPEEVLDHVKKIDAQYGSQLEINGILLSKDEKRGAKKIFFYSGERIPNVPAEWTGLHFCTIKEGIVIPSIEGAQAIGRTAKKAIEITVKDAEYIMSGRDLDIKEDLPNGFYILKSGFDVLGIGKVENKKILNMTPKSRRTMQQYRTI